MGPNGAKCVTSPMVPRAWEKVFILAQGGAGELGVGGGEVPFLKVRRLASLELPAGGGACQGCTPGFESVPAGVGPRNPLS